VKLKMILFTTILILLSSLQLASAQNTILGRWKTIDDETGREKSIVTIYKENGSHQSPVTSHQSPVTSHQSPVTSHRFLHKPPQLFIPHSNLVSR